jgi:transcriptional regulator with GAF, ATPase, and Fis domain
VADDAVFEAAVRRLAGVLIDDATLDSVMQLVIAMAVASIAVSDAASVSVVRGNGSRFETINSTSPEVTELDAVQYRTGQGPCVSATQKGERVLIDLVDDGPAWPEFVSAARAEGVTSVYSSPLTVRDRTMGALNLYSHKAGAVEQWVEEEIETFATSASVVLANMSAFTTTAEQNDQLQQALINREVIGQAKGILMHRDGIDSDEAFDRLRVMSQRSNRKLHDIARDIVAQRGDVPGGSPAA